MIGILPNTLEVDGKEYQIRTDFRVALTIFQAFNDIELTDQEKVIVMLECLYEEFPSNSEEASKQASWFLDGGPFTQSEKQKQTKKVMDWEQDEQLIFASVNKVAGCETRAKEYIHWWTFLGYFNEIGEGLFSAVVNIRSKKNKGKKLDKGEQEFYNDNKSIIDIKKRLTKKEQEDMDAVNKLFY